jgi:hypothetical protein
MVVVHYNPLYSDDNPSINIVLLIDLFWVNFITTSLFSRALESWLGKSSPELAARFR